MGDRAGLTKLDRSNGFDGANDYMRVKKSKLAQQNDQIREALRHRNTTSKTDIFKGISINVNGRTQPTADELKRLILLNGGDYHPYYRYQTTKFMIATNLSAARMKQLRPDDRIVRPEWITESVQTKCLLPYQDYQMFVEGQRGKTGSVLPIDISDDRSREMVSVVESYSKNYRKSKGRSEGSEKETTKSRDIRDMFKSVSLIAERAKNSQPTNKSTSKPLEPVIKKTKSQPTLPARGSGTKSVDIREMFKRMQK